MSKTKISEGDCWIRNIYLPLKLEEKRQWSETKGTHNTHLNIEKLAILQVKSWVLCLIVYV